MPASQGNNRRSRACLIRAMVPLFAALAGLTGPVHADSVESWGANYYGELGIGNTTSADAPIAINQLASGVTSIGAGSNHALAVQNGQAFTWGDNTYGQLGNGQMQGSFNAPSAVMNWTSGVAAVTGGAGHSIAIVNGGVWGWGLNTYGQLGNATTTNSVVPVPVQGLGSSVSVIAAGTNHNLAIKNGGLFSWGSNTNGQLGDGLTISSDLPVPVDGLTTAVTSIAGGYDHSLAIQNGKLFSWGSNSDGELGNGQTTDSTEPVSVRGLTSGITAVAGGFEFSLAVKGGQVYSWGDNNAGQLGIGTTNNSLLPVAISGLTGITQVAAGLDSAYALSSDGSIWDWGDNLDGELGLGDNTNRVAPAHLLPPAGYQFTSIVASAAGHFTLATLAAVGSNGGAINWTNATGVSNNWATAGNWSGSAVPTASNDVTFSLGSSTGYAVNITSPAAAHNVTISNDNLTLNTTGSLSIASNLLVAPAAGAAGHLSVTGSGMVAVAGNVMVGSSGTLILSGSAFNVSGTLSVSAGGVLDLNAISVNGIFVNALGNLAVNGGQLNVLQASNFNNRQLIVATTLSISGTTAAWLGRVDLANNDMDIHQANVATVTNQVQEAYAQGTWNGAGGILSSSAADDPSGLGVLGVIQNNQSGSALFGNSSGQSLFDGVSPGASDVLIKYVYYGDANLDGQVDGSDYSRIDNGLLTGQTGWFNGDFNYDGVIDGSDYTLLDNSFNRQGSNAAASLAVSGAETSELSVIGISAFTPPVPEPACTSFLVVGAIFLSGRRRRR